MRHKRVFKLLISLLFISLIFSLNIYTVSGREDTKCSNKPLSNEQKTHNGLKISTPEEQGMDGNVLSEMSSFLKELRKINSVLILKNGYLIFEEYYAGFNEQSTQCIWSCTKTITSALIGIAIYKGAIKSVHEKVLDFFPEYQFKNVDKRKKEITIEHLLTMSSGLPSKSGLELTYYHDWVKSILDEPMKYEAGTVFDYSTGNTHILSAILQKTTGINLLVYAMENLFGPIGISKSNLFWSKDPQGIYTGGHGLHMRSRDMAKFGLLYLNKGIWNGKRIVPEDWVEKSIKAQIDTQSGEKYGYQWWLNTLNMIDIVYVYGNFGQLIAFIDTLDLSIIFTSKIMQEDCMTVLNSIIAKYIIPAAKTTSGSSQITGKEN